MTQPRPAGGGFDWGRLSTGSKAILVSSVVLIVSLFLPWQTVAGCEEAQALAPTVDFGGCSRMGIAGLGVLVVLGAIALVVWEGLLASGMNLNVGGTSPVMISAIAGGVVALLGLLNFLMSLGGGPLGIYNVAWGAFVGLVLVLALAYASYVRFHETKLGAAGPPV